MLIISKKLLTQLVKLIEIMNNNFKKIFKNFYYALSSNLFNLIISVLIVLVLPKYLGIIQYGYFQLYIFYSSYLGFLQFGWNDGIYLRYAGESIEKLKNINIRKQFNLLLISQLLFSCLIFIYGFFYSNDESKGIIMICLALSLVPIGCRAMFLFLFQATNDFKSFSKVMVFDRLIYLLLVIICLFCFDKNFEFFMYADVMSKYISFLYSISLGRKMLINNSKIKKSRDFYKEIARSIRAGFILMLSNITSMLVIGVSRFFIEKKWDIATFGKISLSLNILSMAMIFITAIGNVLFPTLRSLKESELPYVYKKISIPLEFFSYLILIMYLPMKIVLDNWFSEYSELSRYLVYILPLVIFETKTSLLINSYLKTLRKEKLLLKINLYSVVLSLFLSIVSSFWFHNIELMVFSITLTLFFRKNYSEYKLSKLLNVNFFRVLITEVILITLFILLILLFNLKGYFLFLFLFILYFLFNKDKLLEVFFVKKLFKRS